ncbi:MAG: autotransporter outer membrane beta-barrel domain-containing protein, partial [Lonepinella koalarum]|nr:autotransporter outer membrane beta-barrel domain-containing protein [Lonepinella koalarum]
TWNRSEKENQAQAYFGTHVIQTLIGRSTEVQIGQDNVKENMGGLLLAFDLGGQYPITKNLSLYADLRYQLSLDKHRNQVYRGSNLAREGYNGRIGLRYTW